MPVRRRWLLAAVAVAVIGVAATACDNDDEDQTDTVNQHQFDELRERVQRNEQMFAILTINSLELHEMDEALAMGTIDASFTPRTRTAIQLLALTEWDSSLQGDASTVRDHAVAVLAALEDEDVDAASDAAHELHEGYHDFTEDVIALLAGELPPEDGGPEAHDEEDGAPAEGETPAADDHDDAETPAAEATP